jgi:hypothetical protein
MIVCSIFIVVGIFLIGCGIRLLKRRLAFLKSGERASGVVTALTERKDEDGISILPLFEMKTITGETMTHLHSYAAQPSRWKVGQQANFIYRPGRPETIHLLRYGGLFGWAIGMLALGVDLLVVGAGYYLLQGYFTP